MREDSAADPVWESLQTGRIPSPRTRDEADLVDLYAPLVRHPGPLTIAQLAQSIDGFIATRTGDARFVSGETDRTHLHRLRALVDAVVVGVGTVAADDCRLTVRAVSGEDPVRVVIDPRARMPQSSAVLADERVTTLWLVGRDADVPSPLPPHVEALRCSGEEFAPAGILRTLHARGLQRVLVEGGGDTVSRFVAAGQLDRLFVTTAPLLIGDGVPGIRFSGSPRLSEALRAPTRHVMMGSDVCVELDLSARPR